MAEAAIAYTFMGAYKRKASLFVVEVFRFELDQTGIFPLMLSMTDSALLGFVPMVTAGGRYPLADLCVAFETPIGICFKLFGMTCQAIF